jgi:hypothetical protein
VLKSIEEQCNESLPGSRRVWSADVHDSSVRDQHEQQILGHEVGPQPSGRLGALGKVGDALVYRRPQSLDLLTGGQRHGQQVAQATIVRLQHATPADEPRKACPRIRAGLR